MKFVIEKFSTTRLGDLSMGSLWRPPECEDSVYMTVSPRYLVRTDDVWSVMLSSGVVFHDSVNRKVVQLVQIEPLTLRDF